MEHFAVLFFLLLCFNDIVGQIPYYPSLPPYPNWLQLEPPDGVTFTARNAHASCVFKGKIWVVGGRTDLYYLYNLVESYKIADVWYSVDGETWVQQNQLSGDYFAQNFDALQPGPVAPWYQRYGHTLDAIDITGDGVEDVMVLTGGFASDPSNDVWVTEDGNTWIYAGLAPWSPRAWHGSTVFQGNLWIMGGSPLNDEVWYLKNLTKVERTTAPLTRAMWSNETYIMEWVQMPNAPWTPRVGMGLVSQWYFNDTAGQNVTSSTERIVLIGGYGGANLSDSNYDGIHCYSDVWETYDGYNWTMLLQQTGFGDRAWFSVAVSTAADLQLDVAWSNLSPRIWLFGGGNIGGYSTTNARLYAMKGYYDTWYSIDGIIWTQVNYQEGGGGGSAYLIPYTSQEWGKTTVDSQVLYLGIWGTTAVVFNSTSGNATPGDIYLIGGDYVGSGAMTNQIYVSRNGLYCSIQGQQCNNQGNCLGGASGCSCTGGYTGQYCENAPSVASSATGMKPLARFALYLAAGLWLILTVAEGSRHS